MFFQSSVLDCFNSDIEFYHVKELNRKINKNGNISILTINNKRVLRLSAILLVLIDKQIPLCFFHHLEFELGNYSMLGMECFKKYFKINCSGLNFKEILHGK